MATITKSIGTSSRDYSTITLWEADLDDTGIYSSGDDAVGECYDDSAFDERVQINGGGTVGLGSVTLSVAAGERHDGTAGSGARIVGSSSAIGINQEGISGDRMVRTEWLELDGGGSDVGAYDEGIIRHYDSGCRGQLRNLLIHNIEQYRNGSRYGVAFYGNSNSENAVMNCILYDLENTYSSSGTMSGLSREGGTVEFLNNTVYGVESASNSASAYAYNFADTAIATIKNCIGMGTANSGSGGAQDFSESSPSSAVVSHNMASDTSAYGTGSLDSKTASDQFISIVGGSEDFHLKSGADAIEAGTDLGTTSSGVEIDIDGRDRDSEGDTWDIGADQYVAGGETVSGAITESVQAGDTLAAALQARASISDGVSLGDTQAATATLRAAITEGIQLGEAWAAELVNLATVSEGTLAGDSFAATLQGLMSLAEGTIAGDVFAASVVALVATSEGVALGDAFTATVSNLGVLAEGLTAGDTLTAILTGRAATVEGIRAGNMLAAKLTGRPTLVEGVSLGDSLLGRLTGQAALAERAAPGDTFVAGLLLGAVISEGVALGDTFTAELASLVAGPYRSAAGQVFSPGCAAGQVYSAGAVAGQIVVA